MKFIEVHKPWPCMAVGPHYQQEEFTMSIFDLLSIDRAGFVSKHGPEAAEHFEEYGVMPPSAAEKAAARKGWRLRVTVRNRQGDLTCFQFESLQVKRGTRCTREVWAETLEQAVLCLTRPEW